jgi:hypothetical protein
MTDYSKMTQEEFDEILMEIISEMTPASIMAITGVGEILREELNNEVLERWEQKSNSSETVGKSVFVFQLIDINGIVVDQTELDEDNVDLAKDIFIGSGHNIDLYEITELYLWKE